LTTDAVERPTSPTRRYTMSRLIRLSLALLVIAGFAACARGGNDSGAAGGDTTRTGEPGVSAPLGAPETAVDQAGGTTGSGGVVTSAAPLPDIGPHVIKNASVTVAVGEGKIEDSVGKATSLAARHGGFVLSSGVSQRPYGGSIVIRVPSTAFESTLADLKELGKVRNESVTGEDVSLEFVDLEARLRNSTAQETVLLRLMDRSSSIADTIRVQRQLEGIQLEIERLRGRLRFLEDQTSYATIATSFTEIGAIPTKTPILARAWHEATEAFLNVVGGVVIVLGSSAPFLVLALLGLLIFRRVAPRTRLGRGDL
jgi:uncharacterized protein DUF4349